MYSGSLLQQIMRQAYQRKSHEADFVAPGRFIDGYKQAMEDIWLQLFGFDIDLDEKQPVKPVNPRPF